MRTQRRRFLHSVTTLTVALGLLGTALLPMAARAEQQDGTITVTATVVSTFSLTIFDPTADFGTNLDAFGQPSNSTDIVDAQTRSGGRQYYRWRASGAPALGKIIRVSSSLTWSVTVLATESTGTSSLSVASGDLRFSQVSPNCDLSPPVYDSATIDTFPALSDTTPHPFRSFQQPTTGANQSGCLFLGIDGADTPGTFDSVLTFTLTN